MIRASFTFAAILAATLVSGCTAVSGADYDVIWLGFEALSADAGVSAGASAPDLDGGAWSGKCFTLPLLVGSRVDERVVIREPLAVDLSLTREEVVIVVRGGATPYTRTIGPSSLESAPGSATVDALDGSRFAIAWSSTCR
jgi:hypothetical protein